jgi:hypothetical protein
LSASTGWVEGPQGEVEAFEGGLVGREVASGSDGAPEPGVEALDGVGAEDHASDLDLEREDTKAVVKLYALSKFFIYTKAKSYSLEYNFT